ncbi:MAG: hypothetical protein E6X34_15685 [Clostridium sp.]|uniref:hypothetical protein n=1 Tax=Clostridium sp. TaxID=1506 RepID=UPI00290B5A43|nr:hypothetical protein [Clostridium sp.]MDU4939878.1 hypothetical protein [Clostridium sp.]
MKEVFYNELQGDEQILWSGKGKYKFFEKGSLFQLLFMIVWLSFALYWEYTAYKGGAGLVMLLFGGFFVFVGLNMVFGLPIRRAIAIKNRVYAVSNKRILFCNMGKSVSFQYLDLKDAEIVNKYKERSGRGGIEFNMGYTNYDMYNDNVYDNRRNRGRVMPNRFMFYNIQNVDEVSNIIRMAKESLI